MRDLNFEDYKSCLQTVGMKNKVDRFGDLFVGEVFLQFAISYIKAWMRAIHKYARRCVGDYQACLMLAWQSSRDWGKDPIVIYDRLTALNSMLEIQLQSMRPRTAKTHKRIRTQKFFAW